MTDSSLRSLLETPADMPVDAGVVSSLADEYPAFLLPLVLELRHPHGHLDDAAVARLVERISLSVPDRRRVKVLIDPEGTGRYDRFYPGQQKKAESMSTDDAIDTFLSSYGNIDPEEEALLNRMIFNPVPDYAATLERENPRPAAPRDEQDRLLDAFLAGTPAPAAAPSASAAAVPADNQQPVTSTPGTAATGPDEAPATAQRHPKAHAGSLLSESLAKIFIKQHNYRRAYEIISSLSLNYPEKSIYFADQLRFLRKLIANEEAQQRQKTIK